MTNFYYIGHLKENHRFIRRRYRSYYNEDYRDDRTTTCDFCDDVFDRIELCFVTPEFDSNEDPYKVAWTLKLCSDCIIVIDKDHEIRNFKRLGVCNDEVEDWEKLNRISCDCGESMSDDVKF